MRTARYFIIFALLLLVLIGYKTYEQYQRISQTQQLIIQNESQSLAHFMSAFRQTYQDIFLRHNIQITDKTIHLFPVKTTKEISDRFSRSMEGDVVIRTVSDRPRNPKNRANSFEMEMMHYFREHPQKQEHFVQKGNVYFYSKPLYIKQSCLKCHGKRENALPSIRKKYDKAYDYKLGDLRGLMMIKIKEHSFFNILYADFRNTVVTTLVMYVLFLIIIYVLLQKMREKDEQYTENLEHEIAKKTSEIHKQKDTFQTLFEKASDGILIMGNTSLVECNEQAVTIFGYNSKKQLLDTPPEKLSPMYQPDGGRSSEKVGEMIRLAKEHRGYQFEWVNLRANGDVFFSEVTLTPIVLNGEDVVHIVVRDISEKKKAEKKLIEQKNILHYQAHHDALTGLPNRTLFNDRLEHGVEICKRQNSMLALLFIDLDHFKQINDTLGHHVGDNVLKVVAERLKENLRNEDTLARLGGDEFTIIIEGISHIQETQKLAEKIQQVMAQPIHIDGHTLYITCSIGISIFPQDDTEPENLVKYADAAMYRAKEEGRNNYQFYSKEMTTLAYQRLMMESSLRQAIENDEFKLYYQPQYNGATGELVGLEALIRWQHPEMGLLHPERFIPLAEESDLIVEIDRWVMRTAMVQYSKWYAKGLYPGKLGLNLSMRQLGSSDFMAKLARCLEKTSFRPEWLEFEVTESQVMKRPEESIEKLNSIHNKGISISIDDFGTGYSSLAYLKRLPVSRLKIDQSFVRDIPENKEDVGIVKAIIALSKSLGIGIIAEGVETKEQKLFLLVHGCQEMQGYYYSKPLASEKIEEMLGKRNES
jgi:diguanylate cyclase (GGDEF)-like protein/PAS domain S-box-containing protein